MGANEIGESYITDDKNDYEIFWAQTKTVPNTLGNPLYHWTHMELSRYFDIGELLDGKDAERFERRQVRN